MPEMDFSRIFSRNHNGTEPDIIEEGSRLTVRLWKAEPESSNVHRKHCFSGNHVKFDAIISGNVLPLLDLTLYKTCFIANTTMVYELARYGKHCVWHTLKIPAKPSELRISLAS